MVETFATEIKAFIVDNFLFGQEGGGIADDQSFLESGIIDSTGLLELVSFVEQQYGISIGDRELVPGEPRLPEEHQPVRRPQARSRVQGLAESRLGKRPTLRRPAPAPDPSMQIIRCDASHDAPWNAFVHASRRGPRSTTAPSGGRSTSAASAIRRPTWRRSTTARIVGVLPDGPAEEPAVRQHRLLDAVRELRRAVRRHRRDRAAAARGGRRRRRRVGRRLPRDSQPAPPRRSLSVFGPQGQHDHRARSRSRRS